MQSRCQETLETLLRQDVNHMMVVPRDFCAQVREKTAHYALLPVWLLSTKWGENTYLFAMNGQTGKFVGELPTSPALFWRNAGLLTLMLMLVFRFLGIAELILYLFIL